MLQVSESLDHLQMTSTLTSVAS